MNFNELRKEGKNKLGVIFNLDEHYKGGSHWVSLFSDLEKGQVYFSDSYGRKPEKRINHFINRIKDYLETCNIDNLDIRHNPTQHQKGNSECGVYSINFILRLLKGKTFDHLTRKRLTDEKVNKCRFRYFK
jgi:Ulp1 family protease